MTHIAPPRSLEVIFSVAEGQPTLTLARFSHAVPLHIAHSGRRADDSGFWVELEDEEGRILHQAPHPAMMTPLPSEQEGEAAGGAANGEIWGAIPVSEFSVHTPMYPDAKYITLYGPPVDERGARAEGAGHAERIGRYRIPGAEDIEAAPKPKDNPVLPFDVCGAGRGEVLSVTNLVNHGPHSECFTLFIVGDGFTIAEQEKFLKLAREGTNAMFGTPPINRGLQARNINVVAVNVASNSNKWSEPENRYFGTKHPSDADYPTLLEWDRTCVSSVASYLGISFDWAGIIINEPFQHFGTALNRQFASTTNGNWTRTWVHEIGHAAFGLSDEYMGAKGSYTGPKNRGNLTTGTVRDEIQWAALIEDETPIPTLGNPTGCTDPGTRTSPVSADKVGLFAGGARYVCDIYHSQLNCLMRNSRSHPFFCRVCEELVLRKFLSNPRILAPVPAVARYSVHDKVWSTPKVAGEVNITYNPDINSENFDGILAELLSGTIGPLLDARLKESAIYQPENDPIHQGAYDPDTRSGHWFIYSGTYNDTVFLYTATTELSTIFGFQRSELVNFPKLTEFDSAPLGIQTVLFAASGGFLEMGQLSSTFRLMGDGLTVQHADGLGQEVIGVSSVIIRPRAFVSVVDALTIKMGVYEFISEGWSEEGFVAMPTADAQEFRAVRSTTAARIVAVLGNADSGLHLGLWDAGKRAWTGDATKLPGVVGAMPHFDIAFLTGGLSAVWHDIAENRLMMSIAVTIEGDWGEPLDITDASGLPQDAVVSDLASAALDDELHVVMLLDGEAQHAILKSSSNEWTPFTPVPSLVPLRDEVQALTMHADYPQLFLGLSEGAPVTPTKTEIF